MKEIIFNDNVVQREYRVKIPNAIIDSLQIKEGDPITIVLDMEKEHIIIRRKK